ncbi:MAG: hypothetical protein JRI25_07800 [Deltaproteobacteria bacterium]|nr:hypothetical protein [Deltaproteobacteria bacterium]
MRWTSAYLSLAPTLLLGCPNNDDTGDTDDTGEVEILDPEPVGAPTEPITGRWTCLGDNEQPPATSRRVELPGYVRTLADPGADDLVPAAQVEVFDENDTLLGTTFANPGNDGRVAVVIPVLEEGFTGYLMVTEDGFLDWRMEISRPVTNSDFNGWTWLTTPAERDAKATDLGVTVEPSAGILVGAVHDCEAFGSPNIVLQVDGETEDMFYMEGFGAVDTRTYTSDSGRFVLPNVPVGPVVVKAFGRVESGGPLLLLSSIETESLAGVMSAVALEPRVGLE